MGQNLVRRRPKYVHGYVDRHGKARYYFRRAGFKKVALPGLPWSSAFMLAYENALAGQPAPLGAARTLPGSMRALAVSYFQSPGYLALIPRGQRVYRGIIERFCDRVDRDGNRFGDKRAALIGREHIVRIIKAKADKPEAANQLRKVLRNLMRYAVEIGLRADDPTRDVKPIKVKTDGFHPWTDIEIEKFEQKHPVGSKARLALALLLHTGQRRSDVVGMGRQHIRDGMLHVRQFKTGTELAIPLHPALRSILDASPVDNMTYLTTQFGKPFTSNGFGNWFRDRCNEAGLPQCSAHGLRKAAARWLADAGCTAHEIAAITGHVSLREVQRYTKGADQKRLALAAIEKVKGRTTSG